jgi:hypothetical protein
MAFSKNSRILEFFDFPLGFPGLPPWVSYFLIFEWILQTKRSENAPVDTAPRAAHILFWVKLGSFRKIFL